jgi:DNA-binding transcriptional LysR family regulator
MKGASGGGTGIVASGLAPATSRPHRRAGGHSACSLSRATGLFWLRDIIRNATGTGPSHPIAMPSESFVMQVQGERWENLSDLEVFARVVERSSFTSAGKDLRISTSSVSKHIARLEATLAVQLLTRNTHGVVPTEAGQTFYSHCVKILAAIEEARADTTEVSRELKGVLRVHSTPGVGLGLVVPATIEFAKLYDTVAVELSVSEFSANLIKRGADVIVASRPFAEELTFHDSLVGKNLGASRYVVCASPSYLKEHGSPATPHELTRHRCLVHLTQKRRPDEWRFTANGKTFSVRIPGVYRSNLEGAILKAAIHGTGIARLPEYTVKNDLGAGHLVSIFSENVVSDRMVKAFYPKSRHVPLKVRRFVELVGAMHRRGMGNGP